MPTGPVVSVVGCFDTPPRAPPTGLVPPSPSTLSGQADDEKRRPVLAGLREFLEGKELLVCDRAATDFRAILDIVAGDAERERGRALLDRCRRVRPPPPSLHLDHGCGVCAQFVCTLPMGIVDRSVALAVFL